MSVSRYLTGARRYRLIDSVGVRNDTSAAVVFQRPRVHVFCGVQRLAGFIADGRGNQFDLVFRDILRRNVCIGFRALAQHTKQAHLLTIAKATDKSRFRIFANGDSDRYDLAHDNPRL